MNKRLRNWFLSGGAGSSLNPIYAAYYAAIPNKPSASIKAAQNQFMVDLGALAARMKTGYFFTDSLANAKINIANPATYTLTVPAGEPTFLAANGVKSNGSTYYDQPFKGNEYAGINSDLTAIQYMSQSNVTATSIYSHGFKDGANTFGMRPFAFALTIVQQFTNAGGGSAAATDHKGLYIHSGDGTNQFFWKDGVKTTALRPPTTIGAYNRSILSLNDTGTVGLKYSSSYVAADFLFDRFSDADELTFRTAWNTYKAAAGIP